MRKPKHVLDRQFDKAVHEKSPLQMGLMLHEALSAGDTATALRLISHGAQLEIVDRSGDTPLLRTLLMHSGVALALIAQGADVNAKSKAKMTPLIRATHLGDVAVVRALIEKKADLDCKDHLDNTAVSIAAIHNRVDILKLLIDAGASLDDKNATGSMPIEHARALGNFKIVEMLEAAPAERLQRRIDKATSPQRSVPRLKRLQIIRSKGKE